MDSRKNCNEKEKVFVLSVKQPWAYLIITGTKKIEIRKWSTEYRGKLLIHVSKSIDEIGQKLYNTPKNLLNLGNIIGEVDLSNVIIYSDSMKFNNDIDKHFNSFTWYRNGLYGLVFENPIAYDKPIKIKGRPKIFSLYNFFYLSF